MLRTVMMAAATAAMMSLGACGQGPAEEAGEHADEAADDGMTTTTTDGATTTTTTP